MSRVFEMRALTEELARGFEARVADLADRRRDVHQELTSLCHTRLETAATAHRARAEETVARHSSTRHLLGGFADTRRAIADSQRRALAIAAADRTTTVRGALADTRHTMQRVHATRLASEAALSAEMRAIGHARASLAARQRQQLAHSRADLARQTAGLVAHARAGRQATAASLKEGLAAHRSTLHAEVARDLDQFAAQRDGLARDLRAFGQTWKAFTQTMHAARGGLAPRTPASQPAPPAPSPEPTRPTPASQPPPPAPSPEPTQPTSAVRPGSTEEESLASSTLSTDEIFSFLADHPDGVRLVEMEAHFGVPRIRLAVAVNRLIEENRAFKDDERKLYFAS